MANEKPDTALPRTSDEFIAAAEARPGLVEAVSAGSIDAFVEFFELSGARITSVAVRELVN
jgi:hypothetical protein